MRYRFRTLLIVLAIGTALITDFFWGCGAFDKGALAQTGVPQPEPMGGTPDASRPWVVAAYPRSDVIAGIELDLTTHRTEALGSDIWPITWADDDHQYAAYGDGAGFGVSSPREQSGKSRVSLGVSRIEGGWGDYRGFNVWGGKDAENRAQFNGKGTGIVCIGGVLYMWVGGPDSRPIDFTQLAVSRDDSKTWKLCDWKWTIRDRLFAGAFLNFGRDYSGTRDDFVYSYFTRIEKPPEQPRSWIHETPGLIDLARVPRERMLDQSAYEWFAGVAQDGSPQWTANVDARKPAFDDANGIKIVSVCHAPGINRYLLVYNPRDNAGNFALFEAAEPWGPWNQVAYLRNQPMFMPPEPNNRVSVFHFAPKWWSADGREFTLIFNTGDDRWNTIRGKLLLP